MQVALAGCFPQSGAVEWVTAKALHEKYGGRLAISSFGGFVAVDGRNALLKEYAAAEKIQFHDPEVEKQFWIAVEDPIVLDVTITDPKRIASRFAKPPWQGWGARVAKTLEENPKVFKGMSKSSGSEQKKPTAEAPATEK